MAFNNQGILPAARNLKQFERLLRSPYTYIVVLEVHISHIKALKNEATRNGKKIIIHADLIQGLKTDDFAAEFLCNDIRPAGIISTRSNMLIKAKAKGIIAIQRMFLLDTIAVEKSYSLIERTTPDYIEVLPGVIPHMIQEVHERTNIPVISGGLIRTEEQVKAALDAGAHAMTTSNEQLWKIFREPSD